MSTEPHRSGLDRGRQVDFALVDVFADRPLTGNPLAVVPDADDLSNERMREIAREFNQSETTFLLQPTRAGADQRLRSFTAAGHEVGGAGHNALGAWLWLAHTGRFGPGIHHQEIGDDVLAIEIVRGSSDRVTVAMVQSAPQFGATVDDLPGLAAALGLGERRLDRTLPIQVVSTGAGHLLVPLVDRESVDRVSVDPARLREILASSGGEGCYVFATATPSGHDGAHAYTRFFNPTMGIVEDPATGTAAGPLAALLVEQGRVADGSTVVIDQGHALGRPSRLSVGVAGRVVRLSGGGLTVAEGTLAVGAG